MFLYTPSNSTQKEHFQYAFLLGNSADFVFKWCSNNQVPTWAELLCKGQRNPFKDCWKAEAGATLQSSNCLLATFSGYDMSIILEGQSVVWSNRKEHRRRAVGTVDWNFLCSELTGSLCKQQQIHSIHTLWTQRPWQRHLLAIIWPSLEARYVELWTRISSVVVVSLN